MQCPKCRAETLRAATLAPGGPPAHVCTACGGSFFDYGELEQTLEVTAVPEDDSLPPSGADEQSGPCPRCRAPMRQLQAPGGGFRVERCARCGGVFLDRGELSRLAAARVASDLDQLFRPSAAAGRAPGTTGTAPGLPAEDRAVLARAVDLASRSPEAAQFLRKALEPLP